LKAFLYADMAAPHIECAPQEPTSSDWALVPNKPRL
jgi:hypothetical protein